jgi:hypothetical protein
MAPSVPAKLAILSPQGCVHAPRLGLDPASPGVNLFI